MKYRQATIFYVVHYILYRWIVAACTVGLSVVYDYFAYKRHAVTLREKVVELEWGVFTQNSRELPYRNVQSVNVNQSVLGQMFNYGDLIVTSAGITEPIVFKHAAQPQALRQALQDRINTV